jgi:hypothetical protein
MFSFVYVHFNGGGGRTSTYVIQRTGGEVLSVQCVASTCASVGMGQENFYTDLQYIQLIYFKGVEVRKHEHRLRAPLGQVTFL